MRFWRTPSANETSLPGYPTHADTLTIDAGEDWATTAIIETAGGLHLQLAIVCDGGSAGHTGRQAAQDTAQKVVEYLERSEPTIFPDLLAYAVRFTNAAVHHNNHTGAYDPEAFSTMALLCVNHSQSPPALHIASIGDSPLILLRDGHYIRLNRDHNVWSEHLLNGGDPNVIIEHAYALTRAIGTSPHVEVDTAVYAFENQLPSWPGKDGLPLQQDDTLIACTDGLTDFCPDDGQPYVDEATFLALALEKNADRVVNRLLKAAKRRKTHDDAAVAVILVPGAGRG